MAESRAPKDARLGARLIDAGVLTSEKLERALAAQADDPRRIGAILVDTGAVTLPALRTALAAQYVMPSAALDGQPEPAAARLVPAALVAGAEVVPLRVRGSILTVGAVNPFDRAAVEQVRLASGYAEVQVEVLAEAEFAHYVRETLSTPRPVETFEAGELSWSAPSEPSAVTPADDGEALARHAAKEALVRGATAVFFNPVAGGGHVTLRVDGTSVRLLSAPARLVVAAGAFFAEQADGGALVVRDGERTQTFQVTSVSTSDGRRVALNADDYQPVTLEQLSLPEPVLTELTRRKHAPGGLYLVVGPRGSGRLATAAALTTELATAERQAMVLATSSAVSVNGAVTVRLDSSGAEEQLGAALAQDPDVLFVEAGSSSGLAERATAAAMHGHTLVVTQPGQRAVRSALDLAAAAGGWRVAASLQAVIAQRLVRRVCPDCATAVELQPDERAELEIPAEALAGATLRRGQGCASCHGTGYRGRLPITEVLFGSGAVRAAIRDGLDDDELTARARETGFFTLWESGIAAMLAGHTTIEELRTVL